MKKLELKLAKYLKDILPTVNAQFINMNWLAGKISTFIDQEDVIIPKADLKLLLSLIPDWAKIVPRGLDYMSYGTGNYEGDLEIKERIDKIRQKLNL